MAISETDVKILWGRAGGICSRPGCSTSLTALPEGNDPYLVGEMAHVIAKSAKGPRGDGQGGDDGYHNLILLCPTCHTHIDKAPDGEFAAQELRDWKAAHEAKISSAGKEQKFEDISELSKAVRMKLAENYHVWKNFGPQSDIANRDPSSNAYNIWDLRRSDTIVPNNKKIQNWIESNQNLLNQEQIIAFGEFLAHASAYAEHVINPLDHYPTFPQNFEKAFADESEWN